MSHERTFRPLTLVALLLITGCAEPAPSGPHGTALVSTAVAGTVEAIVNATPTPRGLVPQVATSDATVVFNATRDAPMRAQTASAEDAELAMDSDYIKSNRAADSTRRATSWVWISGFESCPSHSEYGLLVVSGARIWKHTRTGGATQEKIRHGTRVQLMGNAGSGFTLVRYNGRDVLVQTMLVVDYDPSDGVRPDKSQCW